jgi:response regulator RpfG family c-di-GMP phosphodiesterase
MALKIDLLANDRWVQWIDSQLQATAEQVGDSVEQPQKLLIVDDEPEIRRLLSRYLTQRGHSCFEACNGDEALEQVRRTVFDAVVTDCHMPGMGGMDLLRKIKDSDPDLAVVMISGNHDPDIALEALRLGADDYVFKPFKFAEVTVGLSRALEKRKLKFQIRSHHQSLESTVKRRTSQIQHLLYNVIQSLVCTLEAKDPYTDGHSQRVTHMSTLLGQAAGLESRELEILQLGAVFHDLGKIGISENILTKRGGLTVEEYAQIKTHPDVGVRILQPLQELRAIHPIIRHHHEHYDGSGYPGNLAGEDIPLGARIVAVADAFDAMTSGRTYVHALPISQAADRIRDAIGTHFDPMLADLFLKMIESGIISEQTLKLGAPKEEF